MRIQFSNRHFFGEVSSAICSIAAAVAVGSVIGLWFSPADGAIFSLIPGVFTQQKSVAQLLPVFLPLFCSGFAVYIRCPALLLPIAFWKAFFFCYVYAGILRFTGSTGWLLGGLAMFSGIAALPVLSGYWLRHVGGSPFEASEFLAAVGWVLLACMLEMFVISPFLSNILTF